jgi:hypothetical protein
MKQLNRKQDTSKMATPEALWYTHIEVYVYM